MTMEVAGSVLMLALLCVTSSAMNLHQKRSNETKAAFEALEADARTAGTGGTGEVACADKSPHCKDMKDAGFCEVEKYKPYMDKNCRKTCGRLPCGHGTCTFPTDLNGTWYTSHEERNPLVIDVTANTITDFELRITTSSNLAMECYLTDGTYYVLKTTGTQMALGSNFYFYTCWSLDKITEDLYVYRIHTSTNSNTNGERYKIFFDDDTVTDINSICDETKVVPGQSAVLFRKGGRNLEVIINGEQYIGVPKVPEGKQTRHTEPRRREHKQQNREMARYLTKNKDVLKKALKET